LAEDSACPFLASQGTALVLGVESRLPDFTHRIPGMVIACTLLKDARHGGPGG
jgi:hypothetical protein